MESLEKEKTLRVLRVDIGEMNISDITIENEQSAFQEITKSKYLIAIPLGTMFCVVNAETNFFDSEKDYALKLEPNFILKLDEGEEGLKLIKSNAFFVGNSGEKFRSLTNEEMDIALILAGKGKLYLNEYKKQGLFGDNE